MKSLLMEDKLSDMQLDFCKWYAELNNATESAIRAGYSQETAYSQGSRLLKKVEIQKEIARLKEIKFNAEIMPISERKARLSQFAREEILSKHGYPVRTSNIQAIAELNKMDSIGTAQININIEDLKIAILNAKQDDQALIQEAKPKLHLTESIYSQKNAGGNTIV
jgi:phage terminase small subunit